MAQNQTVVELLFRVADEASSQSRNIASHFDGLKSSAMAAAAAAAAVGAGALAVAKQVVDLGSKFEDTSINIAGNIRAFDLEPTFAAATKSAAGAMETIEAMAAKLPGETDQYVEVFKIALPKAIESGMTNIKKITDLTSRFTAVAVSGGIDAAQAGMNLSRMLAGQADSENAAFRMLAPHLKMTAKEFNGLTIEARRLAIDKSLGNFTEMMEAAGGTFSSKMGEAQSHMKSLLRIGGEPIFTAAVEQLSKMNEYFTQNEATIIATGKEIATSFVAGLKTIIDNFDTIVSTVKNLLELWVSFKVGVVASEITTGLFLIVAAYDAITAAATTAAAAQAAATEGVSAIVGLAAAGLTFVGLKGLEGTAKDKYTAVRKAAAAAVAVKPLTDVERAELGKVVDRLNMAAYKITKGMGGDYYTLDKTQEKLAFTDVFKEFYGGASTVFREQFAALAKKEGFDVSDFFAPKVGVPKAPGGPKKADVIIKNARFDIKQSFAEGYDPDRIAAAFVEQIGSTALYPGQSGFASAGTGAA